MYRISFPRRQCRGDDVNISGYNAAMQRQNLFNQTDPSAHPSGGRFDHTIWPVGWAGRSETSGTPPISDDQPDGDPLMLPVQSTTSSCAVQSERHHADNHGVATVALSTCRISALSKHFQAVAGLRFI
jgi:hypothetical protein